MLKYHNLKNKHFEFKIVCEVLPSQLREIIDFDGNLDHLCSVITGECCKTFMNILKQYIIQTNAVKFLKYIVNNYLKHIVLNRPFGVTL